MIRTLLFWLRRVERGVAASLLLSIFVLVFIATAGRYFGHPVIWAIEVTQAMFVWLCLLAADVTLQNYGHFSVPAIADLLSKRARRLLETFNGLVVMALLGFLAWHGLRFAEMKSLRPLPMTGISEGLATAALPVGFALMFITLLEQTILRWTAHGSEETHRSRDVM
ncbi:TRAP transporter small permease [Microbaculum marinum]|uniref:TRAP transporter small permease protein n=1 Tax=Microbaculum marinum TaxID=1764581 RepID=A0AAW9RNX5_9HYPH